MHAPGTDFAILLRPDRGGAPPHEILAQIDQSLSSPTTPHRQHSIVTAALILCLASISRVVKTASSAPQPGAEDY